MMSDCNYDKTKLAHELSAIAHFVEKHGIPDAKKDGHPLCAAAYAELKTDLEKHVAKLNAAVTGLAKEGKYR